MSIIFIYQNNEYKIDNKNINSINEALRQFLSLVDKNFISASFTVLKFLLSILYLLFWYMNIIDIFIYLLDILIIFINIK